jgi:hypothetical protein
MGYSRRTSAYASNIAKSFGAAMTLAHVYPPDPIIEVNMERIDDRLGPVLIFREKR